MFVGLGLPLSYEGVPRGEAQLRDTFFLLSTLVLLFAGPLVLVGVAVTWAYLRWPRALTRRSYYVVLFLVLVANGVLVVTGGWRYALTECRTCDGLVFWPKTVLLLSLFIVFAPLARERIRTALGWPEADAD
jgi:hypothetical protein